MIYAVFGLIIRLRSITVLGLGAALAYNAGVENLLSPDLKVYTYVSNHFAALSPETMRQFLEMLRKR